MTGPGIRIDRHVARVRAVGGGPAPVALDRLADELAALSPAGCPAVDQGIWFVPRLDVHAWWAPGSAEPPARALARQVLARLRATFADGPGVAGVRWFPDRVAWLAQWLLDVGHGRAAGQWEYAELGGAVADVVAAAQQRPAELLAALRSLPASESDHLVAAVAPGVASGLVHAVTDLTAPEMPPQAVALVVRGLRESGRLPADARRAVLAVVLGVAGVPSPRTSAVARDLVDVVITLRGLRSRDGDALLRAVVQGDARAIAALGGAPLAAAFASWDAGERAAAVAVLTRPPGPATAVPPDGPDVTEPGGHTPYGGIFLLLPLLAELPFAAAARSWPDSDGVPASRLLAALAMAAVHGPDRARGVVVDPWLRHALGMPALRPDAIRDWSAGIDEAAAADCVGVCTAAAARHAAGFARDLADDGLLLTGLLAGPAAVAARAAGACLLRELSYRLPGMATAAEDHLRRNVLAFDATVRPEPGRIVVELGRPPLDLLLVLTGMNRRSFTLPATGDRPWLIVRR